LPARLPLAAEVDSARVLGLLALAPGTPADRWDPAPSVLGIVGGLHRDQLDLAAAELNWKGSAGFEVDQGGVGLADHQIAVELHLGGVGQAPAGFALARGAAQGDPPGVQQGVIKGGEQQSFATPLFFGLT
jgi:hypothetical protein